MSKPVRSDGKANELFKKLVKKFDEFTKEALDKIIQVWEQRTPGKQPKLDQCKKYPLMEFALLYAKAFKVRCLPVEYYLSIKLEQAHTKTDYEGKIDSNEEDDNDFLGQQLDPAA